jgi:hypothetical protein
MMDVFFLPGNLGATARNATVRFGAFVDGAMVECEISEKALQTHFGAKTGLKADLINAFEVGREQIHAAAKDRLMRNKTGICLIGVNDFI